MPGFVGRVLRFASRAGLVAAAATFAAYALARGTYDVSLEQERTAATITLMCVGLWILGLLARPLHAGTRRAGRRDGRHVRADAPDPRARDFFALDIPPLGLDLVIATVVVIAIAILELGWHATHGAGTRDERLGAEDR